jgi:putative NADH-flavin reductase
MKKVAVIGGTGSAGREVIRLALKADYKVTAVARIPDSIKPQNNLTVVYGDVTDLESLKEAFKHVDVVISCFGPANGRKAGNIMSVGTYNMVKACEEHAVGRLIFMSGMLQTSGNELTLLNRLALKFIRLFFKGVYRDKIIAENSIQSSSLPWVIVRAVGLSDAAPTGKYSAGVALKVSPFTPLPYTDLALCLLDAVEEDGWTRKIVNVGKE